jgi:hypothetical protein
MKAWQRFWNPITTGSAVRSIALNSIQYNNAKKVKYLKSFSEAIREIIANSDPFTW